MNENRTDADGVKSDQDPFEDDEIMKRLRTPPEFPPASPEQVEQTWSAIVDHLEEQVQREPTVAASHPDARRRRWLKRLSFATPGWSWQLAKVAALLVLGFGAAWIAAGRGWLPGTPSREGGVVARGPDAEPDRAWLAAGDYSNRLETLLLGVSKGGESADGGLAPAVREVSRELLDDNRMYQRVAQRRGDPALSELLSRMEIILLALATAPDGQEEEVINVLRGFIDDNDVLEDLREVRATVPRVPRSRATTTRF